MTTLIDMRFYEELNDFLPADLRRTGFSYELKKTRSVKDLFESIGVPHTEVDLIIVNGESVDFNYQVQYGDHICLYPVLKPTLLKQSLYLSLALLPLKHCLPETLSDPCFVLDVHLGKLAAYLRMMGFDTDYRNDYDDFTLAEMSANEQRILLTCDRQLLMRKQVNYGYFVRARQPKQQLLEILSHYDLYNRLKPFTRCMHCNGKTRAVNKKTIETQLQVKTRQHYNEFFQCQSCNKIYWKGSHYQKMKNLVDSIIAGTLSVYSS